MEFPGGEKKKKKLEIFSLLRVEVQLAIISVKRVGFDSY